MNVIRPNIVLPVRNHKITSGYGYRKLDNEEHTGLDFTGGNNAYNVLDGTVYGTYKNGQVGGYGNLVIVKHKSGLFSLYAHLNKILVMSNQKVLAGDIIGKIGTTAGTREKPNNKVAKHLHFEFLSKWPPAGKDLNRINPKNVFGNLL